MRPHSALHDRAPALFAAQWAKTAAPGPKPVPAPARMPVAGKILRSHLSPLSVRNAGQTGLNRITQAVSSTSTWYAFAGHVIYLKTAGR